MARRFASSALSLRLLQDGGGFRISGAGSFSCSFARANTGGCDEAFRFATGTRDHHVALLFRVAERLVSLLREAHALGYFLATLIDDA